MTFNILAIGDVVGSCGVGFLERNLRKIKKKYSADFIIVNGENSGDGGGITRASAKSILDAGADVITGGNHSLRSRDVYPLYDEIPSILLPANMTAAPYGDGYVILETSAGRILIVNVLGQMFMNPTESPFYAVDRILKDEQGNYDLAVCDIHCEATSEKIAFFRYFADRFQIIFGTHTHVQTADECIIDGCGYITDLGMCGAIDSILGTECEKVINKFVYRTPEKFVLANGQCRMSGALFSIEDKKTVSVTRVVEIES